MSIQQLVNQYNQTAEAPYVQLTPEIAAFLKKLAYDNGAPSDDVEILANHTLLQAKLHHDLYERRILSRLAKEEATSDAGSKIAYVEPEPAAEPVAEPAPEDNKPKFQTGIPELDGFIAEVEKLGGTVIGGVSNQPGVGVGMVGLGMLSQILGGKSNSTLNELYSKLGVHMNNDGPCPGCGGNH